MSPRFRPRLAFFLVHILLAPCLAVPVPAAELDHEVMFDIPAQALETALLRFSEQSGMQVQMASSDVPAALQATSLSGRMAVGKALAALLERTGLSYQIVGDSTVAIYRGRGAKSVRRLQVGPLLASTTPVGLPAAPEADAAAELAEVIVTAQKRAESLQETPIAVTAFSAREIEAQRVTNVMDLLNKAPSVNLAPFAGTRAAPNLFIRGMGNLNAQTTKDMATGIYIDGVPVGRGIGLAADIADLERVELLRGPQGTLWGRNTTAGAINFITRKPDDKLSFGAALTGGSWDLRSGRARINVPITDRLFARVAYMRTENDGWVDNVNATLPDQINFNEDRKKEAVKVALRFEPRAGLSADYGFDSSKMIFGNHFYQIIAGATAVSGRQEAANPARGLSPSDTEVSGHNLTLTWERGAMTLKSISAYRDLDSRTNMNFIDLFTQDNVQAQHQFSQELQVTGDALGNRIKYTMGLFYYEEGSHESIASRYSGGAVVDSWLVKAESTSAAIFGQATWTPPVLDDRLGLTLGLRQTDDSRKATKTYLRTDLSPAVPAGSVVVGDRKFNSLNPAVTLEYAFAATVNGYAKFTTGYRAGGFNTQSTPAYFGSGFDAENVKSGEIGLKSDLLQRRLRVNLAAFRNKYTDLQVDQARTPPIFTDTLNAGSATVKGVELESAAVLARGLTVNFFYSWLDGEYQSYIDNGVELAAVRYMQNAPKYQLGVGLELAMPHLRFGDLVLNVDYRKQAEFHSGPLANTLSPGYQIWNARLQLADIPAPQGRFRVNLWGKNLSDEIYRLSTTNLGIISAQFGPPRSVGMDVSYEY